MCTGSVLRNVPEQRFYIFMAVKVDYKGRDREGIPLSFTTVGKTNPAQKRVSLSPHDRFIQTRLIFPGKIRNVMEKT